MRQSARAGAFFCCKLRAKLCCATGYSSSIKRGKKRVQLRADEKRQFSFDFIVIEVWLSRNEELAWAPLLGEPTHLDRPPPHGRGVFFRFFSCTRRLLTSRVSEIQ